MGWIGVDLDGTLSEYSLGNPDSHIGKPVLLMLERVKQWIAEGKEVKIFTARCSVPEQLAPVQSWLEKHGIGGLEITNIKDSNMVEIWDDRAVRVIRNTGLTCCDNHTDSNWRAKSGDVIPKIVKKGEISYDDKLVRYYGKNVLDALNKGKSNA